MALYETDMRDLRSHYESGEGGRHWFDASTLRFFSSRIPAIGFTTKDKETTYFVTSERYDWNRPRLYTVRSYTWATREIDTVGDFQQYKSRSGAIAQAKRLAGVAEQQEAA